MRHLTYGLPSLALALTLGHFTGDATRATTAPRDTTGRIEDPDPVSGSSSDLRPAPLGSLRYPVGFGFMIHIEKRGPYGPDVYDRTVAILTEVRDVFEAADAIATFECSPEFLEVDLGEASPFLTTTDDMGHHVGLHADIGVSGPTSTDLAEFVAYLSEWRGMLTSGGIPVTHVSGVCSRIDWVVGCLDAGFQAVSGVVDFCLCSTPDESSPVDCACVSPEDCKEPYPSDLRGQVRPWFADSGADWHRRPFLPIADSVDCADLLILPYLGNLRHAAERRSEAPLPGEAVPELADVDAVVDWLQEAADSPVRLPHDLTRPRATYVGLSIGSDPPLEVLEYLVEQVNVLVAEGKVYWTSLRDINSRHRESCP